MLINKKAPIEKLKKDSSPIKIFLLFESNP